MRKTILASLPFLQAIVFLAIAILLGAYLFIPVLVTWLVGGILLYAALWRHWDVSISSIIKQSCKDKQIKNFMISHFVFSVVSLPILFLYVIYDDGDNLRGNG